MRETGCSSISRRGCSCFRSLSDTQIFFLAYSLVRTLRIVNNYNPRLREWVIKKKYADSVAKFIGNLSGYYMALSQVPRDGNIAIREEFDAAMQSQGIEALELFIKRHPDHTLAERAREEVKSRSK